jgi:hypothetical protein
LPSHSAADIGIELSASETSKEDRVGKVREGDMIEIVIDRNRLEGSVDLVGEDGKLSVLA